MGRPPKIQEQSEGEQPKVEQTKAETIPDKKVDTVAEKAALIRLGNKIKHPGPWVDIKPRQGLNVEQELVELQKENRLVGYDQKTGKVMLKK